MRTTEIKGKKPLPRMKYTWMMNRKEMRKAGKELLVSVFGLNCEVKS